jgi:histidine ammonia-lyase
MTSPQVDKARAALVLDGQTLTPAQIVAASRGDKNGLCPPVTIAKAARDATNEVRTYLEANWLTDEAPVMYAINTGLGRLRDVRIEAADLERYQTYIINSHSAGTGEPLTEEESRATIICRVNALVKGFSGLRLACLDRLLDMLNNGVHPIIPRQGSVGASGDLAPLAHLVCVMIGHQRAEAIHNGRRMPARAALAAAGLEPTFELKPKDVIAMINGSTISLACAVLALEDAKTLATSADIALALTLEAMRGELAAFDERIHQARNSATQMQVAENVRNIVAGSARTTDEARAIKLADEYRPSATYSPRVQDAYSIRCAPQVHGAARDALAFAETLLTREANAATDNPLIFPNETGGYDVLSGGNFHGEPIGYAADIITMAVAEIGAISERRCYRLTEPTMSFGLPLNLVGGTLGLNTGFSLVHCSAAAIASENKVLCFPSVVDSLPTKANQEDHVAMCTFSARKARMVVANTHTIIGIEVICATQGIDLSADQLGNRAMGAGSAAAYQRTRQDISRTFEDQYQSDCVEAARMLVKSGDLVGAVAAKVGQLH